MLDNKSAVLAAVILFVCNLITGCVSVLFKIQYYFILFDSHYMFFFFLNKCLFRMANSVVLENPMATIPIL
jgi:hypothetical protein